MPYDESDSDKFHVIEDVELQWILFTDVTRVYLMLTTSDKFVYKTDTVRCLSPPSESKASWSPRMPLGPLSPSTMVVLKLYTPRKFPLLFHRLLGSAEIPITEIFDENRDDEPLLLFGPTSVRPMPTVSLKIAYSSDQEKVAKFVVKDFKRPKERVSRHSALLNGVGAVKRMIDILTEAHPAAKVAWSIISMGIDILRYQIDMDQLVVDLHAIMLQAYEQASNNEVLLHINNLRPIYNALFEQTIQCAKFIESYAKKSFTGRIINRNLSGDIKRIQQKFDDLIKKLHLEISKEAFVAELAGHKHQQIKTTLRMLRPPMAIKLGPKSTCLQGTRLRVIDEVMTWIERCDGGTLWCKGMAGTGKSSLMGTLYEQLVIRSGSRSRLGAFIRCDRKEFSNSSKLITTIAYSLCMFDDDVASAISHAVQRFRWVSEAVPSSSIRDQFRVLLQEPLISVPNLSKEHPVVVIIDALDECSEISRDMLGILAEGFGSMLPFMRLIVSSRPIESITRVFQTQKTMTLITLDTSSEDVIRDIRLYVDVQLNVIYKDQLLNNDAGAFQNVCESQSAVEKLSERANGLFIWAVTVCSFLAEFPCESRLRELLNAKTSQIAFDTLTALYRTTLRVMVSGKLEKDKDIRCCIRGVLGALIVVPGQVTIRMLDDLVFLPGDPSAEVVLAKLRSVVHVSPQGQLQVIHQSLYDFLTDQTQCGEEWHIDVEEQRRKLLQAIKNLPNTSQGRKKYVRLRRELSRGTI
ncbi:uncharacterized protein BT62DRAFT_955983 [Guyanagaster necrorhizus]|uniref:Nephrocystin 3-like N-terminal domain-containing protein n=1 Tax=Guyanagaster necrorhizus TaxID=856835 RepID=A0A9P7VIN9_9AGAR|nr:uncharacterized protein BT62DRAFT_955983 [Guyanagaster necrorhizus MCA 3950]KAG7441293.1 hypothetical protein BT62DRAFT_955983 [Guyanagaster necrorhizus MCA 3950]